jgi:hypothetical protein
MTQKNLFPEYPILQREEHLPARKSDPPSSKAAAREITDSGERDRQMREVLALVIGNPGCTSLELSRRSSLDRYQIARRLPELERESAVHRGQIRRCRIGKRPAVTWYASDMLRGAE